ncbi:MAG: hypothetical protein R2755_18920 [Acidimicrobiales bacterium]
MAAPAELAAAPPPPGLRRATVGSATGGGRGRGAGRPATRQLYEARFEGDGRPARRARPRGLARPAAPYAWSVHEPLAHLTVIEELTVRQFAP